MAFTQNDFQRFIVELGRVQKVFSPSSKGIPVETYATWQSVVEAYSLKDVEPVLADWAKSKKRMLLPSDLQEALAKRVSDRVEGHAAAWKRREMNEWNNPSPEGLRVLERLNNLMREVRPMDSLRWAKLSMVKEAYGFQLCAFQREAWRKALGFESSFKFEGDQYKVLPVRTGKISTARRDPYSREHIDFINQYTAKHGTILVVDEAFC